MRSASGTFVALAFAVTLPADSQVVTARSNLPDYYPLKAGAKWTYEVDAGDGQKTRVTNQLAKIETIDGKELARLETTIGGTVAATEHLSSSPNGVFRHRYNGVEVTPALCILRYPFKEGESWEGEPMIGPQKVKVTIKSLRREELTVPAGKYKAVSVSVETNVNGVRIYATSWYAPDIGVVRQVTDIGQKKIKLELVKFEPGK
jgi:hypothetical protein